MNFKHIKDNVDSAGTKDICARIMDRIEGENISPCPKWQFLCIHYGVWLLWALSVIAGAIAVAVMFYVGNHARFALFEATHATPLSFFVEILPYIWIVVFIVMSGFAYYNLRHTKRGYRYPFTHILISSIIFSVVGGVVLHLFGIGHLIDSSLSKGMPTYPSLERMEMKMWQHPADGRLVGTWQGTEDEMMWYDFTDAKGERWSVAVIELREPDLALLRSGETVRMLGTTTDLHARTFHACGVFPWLFTTKQQTESNTLAKDREAFIRKMYEHMETGDRLKALEAKTYPERPLSGQPFMEGLCADIAAVKRVKFVQ